MCNTDEFNSISTKLKTSSSSYSKSTVSVIKSSNSHLFDKRSITSSGSESLSWNGVGVWVPNTDYKNLYSRLSSNEDNDKIERYLSQEIIRNNINIPDLNLNGVLNLDKSVEKQNKNLFQTGKSDHKAYKSTTTHKYFPVADVNIDEEIKPNYQNASKTSTTYKISSLKIKNNDHKTKIEPKISSHLVKNKSKSEQIADMICSDTSSSDNFDSAQNRLSNDFRSISFEEELENILENSLDDCRQFPNVASHSLNTLLPSDKRDLFKNTIPLNFLKKDIKSLSKLNKSTENIVKICDEIEKQKTAFHLKNDTTTSNNVNYFVKPTDSKQRFSRLNLDYNSDDDNVNLKSNDSIFKNGSIKENEKFDNATACDHYDIGRIHSEEVLSNSFTDLCTFLSNLNKSLSNSDNNSKFNSINRNKLSPQKYEEISKWADHTVDSLVNTDYQQITNFLFNPSNKLNDNIYNVQDNSVTETANPISKINSVFATMPDLTQIYNASNKLIQRQSSMPQETFEGSESKKQIENNLFSVNKINNKSSNDRMIESDNSCQSFYSDEERKKEYKKLSKTFNEFFVKIFPACNESNSKSVNKMEEFSSNDNKERENNPVAISSNKYSTFSENTMKSMVIHECFLLKERINDHIQCLEAQQVKKNKTLQKKCLALKKLIVDLFEINNLDDLIFNNVPNIKKIVMTCKNKDLCESQEKEINIVILQNGITIEGIHANVPDCNKTPIDVSQYDLKKTVYMAMRAFKEDSDISQSNSSSVVSENN